MLFQKNYHDKLKTTDEDEREFQEKALTSVVLRKIEIDSIKSNYDLKHLADIHKEIFKDVSTSARVVRK